MTQLALPLLPDGQWVDDDVPCFGDELNAELLVIAAAKAVCAICPVQAECLAAGVGEVGIWGGLTEAERSGGALEAAS